MFFAYTDYISDIVGWYWNVTSGYYKYPGFARIETTFIGNTISWYSENSAQYQCNMSKQTYYYLAIK